eukprot:1141042-Pelagomonas_calceolata.AAC.5
MDTIPPIVSCRSAQWDRPVASTGLLSKVVDEDGKIMAPCSSCKACQNSCCRVQMLKSKRSSHPTTKRGALHGCTARWHAHSTTKQQHSIQRFS